MKAVAPFGLWLHAPLCDVSCPRLCVFSAEARLEGVHPPAPLWPTLRLRPCPVGPSSGKRRLGRGPEVPARQLGLWLSLLAHFRNGSPLALVSFRPIETAI